MDNLPRFPTVLEKNILNCLILLIKTRHNAHRSPSYDIMKSFPSLVYVLLFKMVSQNMLNEKFHKILFNSPKF